jgi:hypothetical protein
MLNKKALEELSGYCKELCRKKAWLMEARVRRDGTINMNGKSFNSPSLADAAACKRKTENR